MLKKIGFALVLITFSLMGTQNSYAECTPNDQGSCKCQSTYDQAGNLISTQCASDNLTIPSAGTHCVCPPKPEA